MASGSISNRLDNLWKTYNLFEHPPTVNMSSNLVRKSISTSVREKKSGKEQEVADLMCHSKTIADNWYNIRSRQKNVGVAGEEVRRNFRPGDEQVNVFYYPLL